MDNKFIYAIHVDLDKNIREFQNSSKENILYDLKNQKNGLSRLKYRILYDNHKFPSIELAAEYTYTCNLNVDGWLVDISISSPGSYVFKYDNTYIFENRNNGIHIVVTVYKKKIIILNTSDYTFTILDSEDFSNNKQYHIDDNLGENPFIEDYIIKMTYSDEYKFEYDEFGNVDQVTKDNQLYSARDVVYTTKSKKSCIINTISPLLFIFNKGIQVPDEGRIYYENTTCTVRNGNIVDIVREVYETSEEEYEKMIKRLIDADDCYCT